MAKEKVEKENKPKKEKAPKGEFVSKKEFSDFQKSVLDILEDITNRLPNLNQDTNEAEVANSPREERDVRENKLDVESNQVESPVPPKFREIVDELLGEEFGIKVFDFKDRTDFQVDIIVPIKYTSTPVAERFPNFTDVRSKTINRALGETGVREWVMKIRMNLNKHFTNQGLASPFSS